MLGNVHDADDVVQETLLRAWRRLDAFQGRASVRAWLYKIATNACLDLLDQRARRLLPAALVPPADPSVETAPPMTEVAWLQPYPDALWEPVDAAADPAVRYDRREAIELAFVAAVQYLPARQRATLLLCDVLGCSAKETAHLLDTSAASVTSALQRARATLTAKLPPDARDRRLAPSTADEAALVTRYVRAWHAADVDGLVALMRADVEMAMPPTPSWYRGRDDVGAYLTRLFGRIGAGQLRLVPTRANAQPAFAVYARDGKEHQAFAVKVLTVRQRVITHITGFVEPDLFAWFGLPARQQFPTDRTDRLSRGSHFRKFRLVDP
jgi:RNA polymerase sigma-70 factor (ECF subfamily)